MREIKTLPKDLVEAIIALLNFKNVEFFKIGDPVLYHSGTGQWIRNNWGLWDEDSELSQFFHSIDIHHADDMSAIILTTTHRILNRKPIDLKGQVERYIAYWKQKGEGIINFEEVEEY